MQEGVKNIVKIYARQAKIAILSKMIFIPQNGKKCYDKLHTCHVAKDSEGKTDFRYSVETPVRRNSVKPGKYLFLRL